MFCSHVTRRLLLHCVDSPYIPLCSFPLNLSPRMRGEGIQGLETDPGFRVSARNDNPANSRKEKNMYALIPFGTSCLTGAN